MERVKIILTAFPYRFFSILTIAVILWLTLFPDPLGDDAPAFFPGADKIVHGIMFGFLTLMFLLDRQRKKGWRPLRWTAALWSAIVSALIGIAIEFAQLYMHLGRGFEYADMIADAIGAAICAILWMLLQPRWSTYE